METSKTAVLLQRGTYLEPARLPNLITVAADVLAGYWIANGVRIDSQLLWLLLATPAVYAAGYALNDYCNRETESWDYRGRPIPSGRMEPWKALILSFALFTIGLTASALAGGSAPYIMILLILSVLLYNVGTREKPFVGPMNMAGCRSLNLILGMGVPFWLGGFPSLYFPVFSFFYVFLLSCLGRSEVGKKLGEMTILALLGWAHFVTILLSLSFSEAMSLENLPFLAFFAVITGPPLLKAGQFQNGLASEGALKMMVLGIPLLNAVFCAGIHGFAAGVPVALCTGLAYILPTDFRMT
jgi:4-hydroxybenzoate polyprenyltransferase